MKIEVSNGEIIDKLTILEIKLSEIKDAKKLTNIRNEYNVLTPIVESIYKASKDDKKHDKCFLIIVLFILTCLFIYTMIY